MKKLFAALLFVGAGATANAGLFITNSSDCDASVQVYAHDANLLAACSYYYWVEVAHDQSRAYNNVTDLNAEWTLTTGAPGTYVPITTTGSGFDAAGVSGVAPIIGNPGTCAAGTLVTYTSSTSGCNFKATWANLGGGNIFINITP